ncbi:hypothetical protein AZSI13_30560 [Azospira sp. I13]|nr:hypothetical protein AZSI13_30560 [Azospira sp. I13]
MKEPPESKNRYESESGDAVLLDLTNLSIDAGAPQRQVFLQSQIRLAVDQEIVENLLEKLVGKHDSWQSLSRETARKNQKIHPEGAQLHALLFWPDDVT